MRDRIEIGYQAFVCDGGDCDELDDRLRRATGHAHDAEVPGL
jgi:hypothetical protein